MKGFFKSEVAAFIYVAIIAVLMMLWFIEVLIEELQ
jgi:hypothetical protein